MDKLKGLLIMNKMFLCTHRNARSRHDRWSPAQSTATRASTAVDVRPAPPYWRSVGHMFLAAPSQGRGHHTVQKEREDYTSDKDEVDDPATRYVAVAPIACTVVGGKPCSPCCHHSVIRPVGVRGYELVRFFNASIKCARAPVHATLNLVLNLVQLHTNCKFVATTTY
jgi:hypothetical protein